MPDVAIKYKGSTIAEMSASGSKTLQTQGKYCEGDIAVEYAKPAGPSGTKQISITQNGTTTEDVAAYANAEITVDVQGGGSGEWSTDGIADGSEPSGDFVVEASTLASYAFAAKSNLGKVTIKNASDLSRGVFELAVFDTISFENISSFSNAANAFLNSTGNAIVFKGTATRPPDWKYIFRYLSVNTIDFSESFKHFSNGNLYQVSALSNLILRNKSQVVAVNSDTGILNNAEKAARLTVYVPSALLSQYQAATNWAVGFANNSNMFQPIEGSIYETQYADGTPIPTT